MLAHTSSLPHASCEDATKVPLVAQLFSPEIASRITPQQQMHLVFGDGPPPAARGSFGQKAVRPMCHEFTSKYMYSHEVHAWRP